MCLRESEVLADIYRCRICHTQLKRDRMDIEAHLKSAHKTTLKIYSANFENPSNQESLEATVSRLVGEGKLEDPAKNKCKTPKKIKHRQPVVKREIISNKVAGNVSENVPEDQEARVIIKSEIKTEESSLDSLIAGCGGEEFNNFKSIDPYGPVGSSAGYDVGVRYKCAMSGCSWVCGKEEMRGGVAAFHLLKAHNTKPQQMREGRIKFHKIQGLKRKRITKRNL